MPHFTLVHSEENREVSTLQIIKKCTLFRNNFSLLTTPYSIKSPIPLTTFQDFISIINGQSVPIADSHLFSLSTLCKEFGFTAFVSRLSKSPHISDSLPRLQDALFPDSFTFVVNGTIIESSLADAVSLSPAVQEQLSVDSCARQFILNESGIKPTNILSLECLLSGEIICFGQSDSHSLAFLSRNLGNSGLECLFVGRSKSGTQVNLLKWPTGSRLSLELIDLSELSVEALDSLLSNESISIQSEDALLELILKLGVEFWPLLNRISLRFLSADGLFILAHHFSVPLESVWSSIPEWVVQLPPPCLDSLILSDFPNIFVEFRRKRFSLLWRGSRDGFGSQHFHCRCDGHGNTLTVILDVDGNIFGGFTPVEWDSKSSSKADESLKSFLFTLKNPQNIPPRKFPLKEEKKHQAIRCNSGWGPCFSDISFFTSIGYTLSFGSTYLNDTGLGGEPPHNTFLTGREDFSVKEIEVFEITD
jgi:hypothetical protein